MIEVNKVGLFHDRKVKAVPSIGYGCDYCCFEPICNRKSNKAEHRVKPKLFLECMAKYRVDNNSVYFVNVK